jgi:hypothetical protein
MKRLLAILLFLSLILIPLAGSALAQDYYFQVPQKIVHAYWESDGSLTLFYTFVFQNDPSGHVIDFVDVGLPNGNYNDYDISASIDGQPADYVSSSEFQGEGGYGVAVALGSKGIPPGGSGTVTVYVPGITGVLYEDSQSDGYASAVFVPAYFISSVSYGISDTTMVFHFPQGLQPDQPRWHTAPAGFPAEPETGIDDQGRIYYAWRNPSASPSSEYSFGASFPLELVPDSAIVRFNFGAWLEQNMGMLMTLACCGAGIVPVVLGAISSRKRQLKYLPPKISIEGNGIKRGLTAVEAAILLEQPLDKVLTMILFGVLKKEAAQVVTQDPLKVKPTSPLPEGLNEYEKGFLQAFEFPTKAEQQRALSTMTVNLVKSISEKMKGFSRRETIDYYKSIVDRAWTQVQEAATPEVKSKTYDELMEWTMLDKNYEDRMQDVFRNVPVYVPTWWGRYNPTYSPAASRPAQTISGSGVPTSTSGGGSVSLPTLPGANFAASVINGVSNFSAGVIGNVNTFTSGVTTKTNPVPVATSSGSGRSGGTRSGGSSGGRSCACACACAGCACACAGGGR